MNIKFCLFRDNIKIFRKIGQLQNFKTPIIIDLVSNFFVDNKTMDDFLQYYTIH